MSRLQQAGFTIVELVLIVVVVGGLIALGTVVVGRHKTKQTPLPAQSNAASTTQPAPDIQTAADLDKATQTLDQTSVNGGARDITELDAQLAPF